ncbi:uncharacterized protein BYT42DRAFT_578082 [Radiomyces spectabilis]|uniref:uncharacterized protein n=1 Tax=Radiomyces spectabilis TaxID=64574 RepID=UPI00221F6D97|nr:uncharacterized protein BYT42DRAFT_578082 [Radiomyces spectabilis]KAI8372803.1 hypothetical protein BYT42DRAFT_578082 [Radiomyces spectabilis]
MDNQKSILSAYVEGDTETIDTSFGFRLQCRNISEANMNHKLSGLDHIALHQLDKHLAQWRSIRVGARPSDNWATTGIVDRVHHKADFCVARLTNMRGTDFHLFVFGRAFKKYQSDIAIGAVVTVLKPTILMPQEVGVAAALHANEVRQICVLGQSLDMGRCEALVQKDKQCEAMIDRRMGDLCERHITKAYNMSKNGRMELASGNTGLDVRWAQATEHGISATQSAARRSKEETYVIKGRGAVTTDGRELKARPQINKMKNEKERSALSDFLKGRTDPGAVMIRKSWGIQEEEKNPILSRDAIMKLGLKRPQTSEEAAAKKRSMTELNQLLRSKNAKATTASQKKEKQEKRYIEL